MKKLISILLVLILHLYSSQDAEGQYFESSIYKLKLRLEKGDKKALNELAPYFDSSKKLAEFLGHHYNETEEFYLAKRTIEENFIFPEASINLAEIKNAQNYSTFLNKNKDKIKYYPELEAFYITPIYERKFFIEFRELPAEKIQKLIDKRTEILSKDWIKAGGIAILIQQNNPECLLKICKEFYRRRDKFNNFNRNKEDFFDLLKLLTYTDIGPAGRNDYIVWDTRDMNFDNSAILNLLIYFSKNYTNFKWNVAQNYFENSSLQPNKIDNINSLVENLSSDNDSIALNSFIHLSQSDVKRVNELSFEKEKNIFNQTNQKVLPLSPFKFLTSLSLLTEYCRKNKIDFIGTEALRSDIGKLKTKLPFNERRKLEDKLIQELTFKDITALEYWTIVNENNYNLQCSISRIADIYYSKNWSQLLKDTEELKLYLKKSKLFKDCNINGNFRYYLIKFTKNSPDALMILNNLKTDDPDINFEIANAKKVLSDKFEYPFEDKKFNDANFDGKIFDIQSEIDKIRMTSSKIDDFERDISKLFSKIHYSQIPDAIKAAEKIKYNKDTYRNKYSFLEKDFGFFLIKDFENKEERENFLKIYAINTEENLYKYYLDKAEIDYKNTDETLNYDKIFELIKFDVIQPYIGNYKTDNEVYSLIKLLEIEFKTRLGFPDKLCNSQDIYGCDSSERRWDWMKFLTDKNLLKQKHSDIVSFSYEEYLEEIELTKILKENEKIQP
ncbi:hypothetical protein K0U91_08660 [Chryseobacterium chendengshani]|uniref:hypothetical protein n=1 Tax=Chryseobacterium sp. LJ668 TaxID=2864040 RepID=UPI001C691840|nr:hypothetical protein [Chryseobacterium sp. LJ668]MBW8524821.1 hypothetical protein [Chryseobacterium sp. LJ668]QYK15160.1 hypothetical protein K0U91_08660 [Chryseobacterium sp. LJ668]